MSSRAGKNSEVMEKENAKLSDRNKVVSSAPRARLPMGSFKVIEKYANEPVTVEIVASTPVGELTYI